LVGGPNLGLLKMLKKSAHACGARRSIEIHLAGAYRNTVFAPEISLSALSPRSRIIRVLHIRNRREADR